MDYIKTFPINDDPELFGLHPNADITFAQSQTYKCLSTLLLLQPKMVGGAASSQEEVTNAVSKNILEQMPKLFDLDLISQRFLIQLIQGDGTSEVFREQVNIFHWNLECSLVVQTLFPKYFGLLIFK